MEGDITATVYSLVLSENNSSEIVVTVETNSKESPDTLTNLLTQPLEQRLQEFSNIDEQFMFRIVTTERHGMFRISAYIMPFQCRSEGLSTYEMGAYVIVLVLYLSIHLLSRWLS